MNPNTQTQRGVTRVMDSVTTHEGEGFLVHRPFPTRALDQVDPFLLLDEMGPVSLGPGEAKGAPDHPHRGFETVTYMLEGAMEHKDSRGHRGRIGPGDVQWMTAGSGVVHSEMPGADVLLDGGRMHGFQLWVNLPWADKMIDPRYQEIPAAGIPEAVDGKVRVRVIAGEALGARAVIDTRTPIVYLHFILEAGGRVSQPIPSGYNAFAYVLVGSGRFGASADAARRGQMVLFERDGDAVTLQAPDEPLQALLLAGRPLDEPVARYGPFVMNTEADIQQAIIDYRMGRMGAIT